MEAYNRKVSVIIPVYNVEKYIEKCLESVCNQTLKDIEIICVNDGSTDDSRTLVQKVAEKDKRILILEQQNKGLSAARNAGLKAARGEYVLFLDSDDTLEPYGLELLYQKAVENQTDTLFFGAKVVYEAWQVKWKYYRRYHRYYDRKGSYPEILKGTKMLQRLVEKGDYRMSACLQLLRRQFLLENNLQFYEGILHEDNLFTFQVMLAAQRVLVTEEKLYVRLMRDHSIMTAKSNVNSSWGYFICLCEMVRLTRAQAFDSDIEKTIHSLLMTIQREAVLPIQGMDKDAVLSILPKEISTEDKLQYELFVLNGEWMRQQRRLGTRIVRRIKK